MKRRTLDGPRYRWRKKLREGAARMWQRRARTVHDLTTGTTYPTARECAAAIGCHPALVCKALARKVPLAKGHRLRWADAVAAEPERREVVTRPAPFIVDRPTAAVKSVRPALAPF